MLAPLLSSLVMDSTTLATTARALYVGVAMHVVHAAMYAVNCCFRFAWSTTEQQLGWMPDADHQCALHD